MGYERRLTCRIIDLVRTLIDTGAIGFSPEHNSNGPDGYACPECGKFNPIQGYACGRAGISDYSHAPECGFVELQSLVQEWEGLED